MDQKISQLVDYYKSQGFDYKRIREEIKKKGYNSWDIDEVLEYKFGKGAVYKAVKEKKISMFSIFWKSIIKPKSLFLEIKDKTYPWDDWKYFAFIFILFIIILNIIPRLITIDSNVLKYLIDNKLIFILLVSGYVLNFDLAFLGWGWIIFFRTWKGDSFWSHTTKVSKSIIYSSTLIYLLGWIPFLNIFSGLYVLYIQTLAMSIFLDENQKKILKTRIWSIIFEVAIAIFFGFYFF